MTSKKTPTRNVKSLKAKGVEARQAKSVRGGGNIDILSFSWGAGNTIPGSGPSDKAGKLPSAGGIVTKKP
jgi:hypothetical protein